jgi:hypothetical protein
VTKEELEKKRDEEACGEFITTCFNLNDPLDKFQSTWAHYGFQTGCNYMRQEVVADLERKLVVAKEALRQIGEWPSQPGMSEKARTALKEIEGEK